MADWIVLNPKLLGATWGYLGSLMTCGVTYQRLMRLQELLLFLIKGGNILINVSIGTLLIGLWALGYILRRK